MSAPGTMRALVLEKIGPPENLKIVSVPVPEPGDDDILIKVELAGLLYSDAEARRGTYFSETIVPWYPGREAAGTIARVGRNVKHLRVGDRVAALVLTGRCQAEYVLANAAPMVDGAPGAPADIIPIPDHISYGQALVYLVNFRLAYFALHGWSQAKAGSRVLIHGASGGMGSVLTQLAKAHGCEVIATLRSEQEAAYCRANGAAHCINVRERDYVSDVLEITGGRGVDIVFNGVGGPTVNQDPKIVVPFGEIHLYGYVAGKPDLHPFDIKHSIAIKTFSANDFFATAHFANATAAMHDWFSCGPVLDIGKVFALEDAATAHHWLEEGRVLGKIALQP